MIPILAAMALGTGVLLFLITVILRLMTTIANLLNGNRNENNAYISFVCRASLFIASFCLGFSAYHALIT